MSSPALLDKRIIIVDDQAVNVKILEQMLREAGYVAVQGFTDPEAALAVVTAESPDLVVLDLLMPVLDGYGFLHAVRERMPAGVYLPILVVTADVSQDSRRRALNLGATDFLTKPFDEIEVLLRIENLLRTRWQYLLLHDENDILDHKVLERTRELEVSNHLLQLAQLEIVERLAIAGEFRDDDTGKHTARVGRVSELLAVGAGLPSEQCQIIGRAAPLHDVGKIGIPDAILLKPGKLTAEEFAIMQRHAAIGADILGNGHSPLVRMAEVIAMTHHERWNGKGYPRGLTGEKIPIEGRIVGIADVFDALTHGRAYKAAWSIPQALAEIERVKGEQFDPTLVEAFMQLPHAELI